MLGGGGGRVITSAGGGAFIFFNDGSRGEYLGEGDGTNKQRMKAQLST